MTAGGQHAQHEPAGVRPSTVLVAAGGFALLVAVALAAVWLLFGIAQVDRREGARVAAPPADAFPPPRLQAEPPLDLARLRRREAARLSGYAWIDRGRGLIRIPIERAMALIAAHGAGGYAPIAAGAAAGAPAAPAPGKGGP